MAFTHYTGFEYLLIDAANQADKDKMLFEERIQWTLDRLENLEDYAEECPEKTRAQYLKACMSIRRAQRGEAIGHRAGLDATNSGMQIMSTLTGCHRGAEATGLINPNVRADAYRSVTDAMNVILHAQGVFVDVPRSDAKDAVMTSLYGSEKRPKVIFGDGTTELASFYEAMNQVAPGAWELLQELKAAWQPFALEHSWTLPDGFCARVKVMTEKEARLEVDELDHATFTYIWYENEGQERGISLPANVTHSVDAYVLRCLIRRCNYDPEVIQRALDACFLELVHREATGDCAYGLEDAILPIQRYVERFKATNMVDAVIAPYLDNVTVECLSDHHLRRLVSLFESMLKYPPFEVTSVHDEFCAHVNHLNVLRQVYIDVFAELANSTILDDIFYAITGVEGHYVKKSTNLAEKIRGSAYAIG